MSKHIGYFDFLRGIAIIMVVGIHTFPKSSWNNESDLLNILIRQLINCAVPIFLAISAFFLARKSFDSYKLITSFWKKQIPKVYIPCIVWSLPLFLMSLKNGGNPITETVILLICGYSIYYFIALIIQYYLLLPWLVKIKQKIWIVVFPLISIISISLYIYSGSQLPLIFYAGPFWIWIMFFYQGIIMGRSERNYSITTLVVLLLIAISLQLVESWYLFNYGSASYGIKASAYIYSSIVLFILFSKKAETFYETNKNIVFSFIEYIGRLSFGIYLIHCYFITFIINRIIGNEYWGIRCFCTILCSIFFIEIIKKVVPNRFCTKYLGFL